MSPTSGSQPTDHWEAASAPAEKSSARARHAPSAIRFTQWPLRDEPLRSGLLVGLFLIGSAAVGIATDRWSVAILIFALLNLLSCQLWLPLDLELGPRGIVYAWLAASRIAWSDVGRWDNLADGVRLWADRQPQPLSSLRSLFIRWHGRREELTQVLEFYLGAATKSGEGSPPRN